MNQLIPVVVVSDSGGASAAVYEYIEGAKKGTSARIPPAFAQPKQLGVLEAIAAAHRGSKDAQPIEAGAPIWLWDHPKTPS